MSFVVAKGDLFEQKVDAIVIPSQPSLKLEGVIGDKARELCGEKLDLEIEQFHKIQFGDCVIANSYCDTFPRVILVANPKWQGGKQQESYVLSNCYTNCLDKASAFGLKSIAFPLLSAGAYHFPLSEALQVAMDTISDWLNFAQMDVTLVIHDQKAYDRFRHDYKGFDVQNGVLVTSSVRVSLAQKERERFEWYKDGLETLLAHGTANKSFKDRIEYYVGMKGIQKTQCYAGVVSSSMFNYYLNGAIPKKYTVVPIGINMGLSVDEINDLLESIGEKLDESFAMDQIIIDGINKNWEVGDINKVLASKHYPLLKVLKDS